MTHDLENIAQQALTGLASGVVALDARGKVLLANPAAASHLGVEPAALAPGADFTHAESVAPMADLVEQVKSSGDPVARAEIVIQTDYESPRIIGVSVNPLAGGDEYSGAILLFTDMTERRNIERIARVNEHLAALGELAAGVVHQLRNPLTIISGRAEMLERAVSDDARANKSLTAIHEEVIRMEASIAQFLAFARPFEVSPIETTAAGIVDRAIALNETEARNRGVSISAHVPDAAPSIVVDKMRIGEALSNLIDNALDAVPDNGTIAVQVHQIGDVLAFEVLDNGPGIDLEEGEDLLSPFLTKKHDGTGLGLSVVNRIVTAHDGRVEYGNRETGGAWFRISLPIKRTV